jgi:hypothetical protein
MSQVIIAGDTSGTITLQAPAVSGSTVLTLPATTATLATLTTPSFASTIGVGGTTAANTGAGISFPATQSASSDANTLDDYEEGSFTPTYTGSGGNPTVTYSSGNTWGIYTKVGNLVSFALEVRTTAISGGGGNLQISGLPFTPYGGGSNQYVYSCAVSLYNISFSQSYYTGQIPNATYVNITGSANGVAGTTLAVSAVASASLSLIRITGTYQTS